MTVDLLEKETKPSRDLAEWELREEIFWKQKSRIDWLQEGDKNTTFFHSSVKEKSYGNLITSIISRQGDPLSSFQAISKEVVRFFSSLFTKENQMAGAEEDLVLDCIPQVVSREMNNFLLKPISLDEVESIVFQMKKGKAPGPDGFPIDFF